MVVFQLANGNVYPTVNSAAIGAKMGYIGKSGRFVAYTEPF